MLELEKKVKLFEDAWQVAKELKKRSKEEVVRIVGGFEPSLPEELYTKLFSMIKDYRELWKGEVLIAMQEFAEAKLLWQIISKNSFENPGFPEEIYLLGLCDAVGELKRYFLQKIIANDLKEAKRVLEIAIKINDFLYPLEFPEVILAGFRRKKDVVRAIVSSMLSIFAQASLSGKVEYKH